MKNVLIVSHGAALGGSPISALNIARFIDKTRFRPVFLFGEDEQVAQMAKNEGFSVYIAKKSGFLGLGLSLKTLKIIKDEKIDIVHLNTLTSYYKYPAFAAKIAKKPILWFVREDPTKKRCLRLMRYLNALATKIITVSYDSAKNMSLVNPNKLKTIRNGIDLSAYNANLDPKQCLKELGLDENEYISTIASLEERKGILELIQAYAKIAPKYQNTRLLIVGKDRSTKQEYLAKMQNLIQNLAINERVIIYGESKKIKQIMRISTLFVLYSAWEGLSRVLLEAMACAKAIVASNAGGNAEQVKDGYNGFCVKFGDINGLANALDKALSDKARIRQFQINSRLLCESEFDIKRTTQEIQNLYESALKNDA